MSGLENGEGGSMAPRIEELLARWVWDAADLSDEELRDLQESPAGRAAMEGLRETERDLEEAWREDRDAVLESAVNHVDEIGDAKFAQRALAAVEPAAKPGVSRLRWITAAAAILLIVLWVRGDLTSSGGAGGDGDKNMPLGPDEIAVEWDRGTGQLRWRGRPASEDDAIVVELRSSDGGGVKTAEILEGDAAWEQGACVLEEAFRLERGVAAPREFTVEVRFEKAGGMFTEKRSKALLITWP